MTVIWLNGTIGSGKTAVGRAVAALLPQARFVDGDDLGGPAGLLNRERWRMAVDALLRLVRCRWPARLVVAYPLAAADARRLRAACACRVLLVVNLATPLPIVLRGRGGRVLSAGERRRVREMFSEGYHRRRFADMTLTNALPPVSRIARVIARRAMRGAFPSPARRS